MPKNLSSRLIRSSNTGKEKRKSKGSDGVAITDPTDSTTSNLSMDEHSSSEREADQSIAGDQDSELETDSSRL